MNQYQAIVARASVIAYRHGLEDCKYQPSLLDEDAEDFAADQSKAGQASPFQFKAGGAATSSVVARKRIVTWRTLSKIMLELRVRGTRLVL